MGNSETKLKGRILLKPSSPIRCMLEKQQMVNKLILTEEDLDTLGVWNYYSRIRGELLGANDRQDCLLIQGAAFVIKRKAFLILGVGGVDFLDSLAQLDEIDGVIGNGNALFLSRDFQRVYSTQNIKELIECYELEGANAKFKFLESADLGPAIFLLRSFRTLSEYEASKIKSKNITFEVANTFARKPIRFCGRYRSRLREKFLATVRVVHCARRPTLRVKECLFDSYEEIRMAIERFQGFFVLVYTLWSQEMCDVVGMRNTRKLSKTYNPTDPITPHLAAIARSFL